MWLQTQKLDFLNLSNRHVDSKYSAEFSKLWESSGQVLNHNGGISNWPIDGWSSFHFIIIRTLEVRSLLV
jgi:hypothetical protein